MEHSSIQLSGSQIEQISLDAGRLRVSFSRAYIVKTMTGSVEKTLWWQAGALVLEGAEAERPLPSTPAICDGGDVEDNVYIYRDMIPVPLDSRGYTGCDLGLRNTDERIVAKGETMRLELAGSPKYIRHFGD
ncbi:MAG: hypothetical protein WBG92_14575 [Thiohalocapsa sp.]